MLQKLFENFAPKKSAATSSIFERMLDGAMSDDEIVEELKALNDRGFGAKEIYAAASALRARMTVFKNAEDAVDCCGTGGDRHGTLNVSTAAAFVLAGGGVRVAKHGNRAVSSLSGSTDVLSALGANIEVGPDVMQKALRQTNLCYLAAPFYHPAMKHVGNARKVLGTRSIFNVLGPLVNPAKVKRQVIGVYDKKYLKLFPPILKKLGSTHVYVVHGEDGLDEITTTSSTLIAHCSFGDEEKIETGTFTPAQARLPQVTLDDLKGGDAVHNAKRMKALFQGEKGPYRDIVLLNAAAGFVVADRAKDISEGMQLAARSIDDGKAAEALDTFALITSGTT